MKDAMTDAWFHQLKAANRQLIKKNGGIEPSAELTSLSKSQIGRCNSSNDTELLPIPAVLRLEMECEDPVVTRVMAALNGCKLTDPKAIVGEGACLLRESMELSTRQNAYQMNASIAFADLNVSPNEGRKCMSDLDRVIEQATALKREYATIVAKGGVDAPALRIVGEAE
ncbi:hypothetical protein IFT84_20430 [Rhizobium sp. CFBP 8762]|uniref:hypothetical protein n=1 Tax=Rhizobium sp. CFBP 8762 TaxID=2775279 RepID=UPI0017818C50|nr:hypothetical protein [Rhizobium sp. CFBP 8762]MBD8556880.1 hypothetical protein [Rhizobium sp. CFBP 8762]